MKRNSSRTNPKRSVGGFTLVELIVVIAVLAILAGVGAVAYTGYIEYAKKGQDRATVGDVMHALELANYNNDDLFGGENTIKVYVGKNGMVGSTTKVTAALEDVFGSLSSVKPQYFVGENGYTFSSENLPAGLNTGTGSVINEYWENYKENGVKSSFADDMDEYWDAFSEFVNNFNNNKLGNLGFNGSAYQGKVTDTVINNYKSLLQDTTEKQKLISAWTSKEDIAMEYDGNSALKGMDLALARNYAFLSYAKRQPGLTAQMSADLTKYESFLRGEDVKLSAFYEDTLFSDSEWSPIIDSYFAENGQAEADVLAYLGLMEAAGSVNVEDKGDESYLDAVSKFVPDASNAFNAENSEDFNATREILNNIGGCGMMITATKKWDGTLSFTVKPSSASPRENNDATEEPVEIEYTASTLTAVASEGPAPTYTPYVALNAPGDIPVETIVLSATDTAHNSCTINAGSGYFVSITVTIEGGSSDVIRVENNTIYAVGKGNASVTITPNGGDWSDAEASTFTVEVY